jgi:hypothetical protein
MDRTTTRESSATTAAITAKPPARRWSDGPNYAWSPVTEEDWSIATHWPALVAVLCEQVAGGTNDVTREIERLRESGKLSHADAQAMRRAMQAMRSSGIALQQIVRLGAGRFNLSPDRVELGSVCRAAVRERQRDLLRRRVDLSCDLHRAEVWVDGAVAAGLLQAAIDWALSFSHKIRLKVVPGDGSEPARIVIRAALPLASQAAHGNRRMNDNLHWVLLRQLGDCARLPTSRSSSAATESAVIEFPATIASGARIA